MDGVDQPPSSRISPSAAVMIGGKWSGLEPTASPQFPFVGLGVHLGVDLAR